MSSNIKRKLAAVMFTDIVGFTQHKRMQQDLDVIESKISKELFLENFTYGKLIIEEFNKG